MESFICITYYQSLRIHGHNAQDSFHMKTGHSLVGYKPHDPCLSGLGDLFLCPCVRDEAQVEV